jgi:hypothetical protein
MSIVLIRAFLHRSRLFEGLPGVFDMSAASGHDGALWSFTAAYAYQSCI